MRTLLLLTGLLLFPMLAWAQDAQIHIARQHISQHAKEFGVTGSALAHARVTDAYTSRHSGVTHVYLRQQLDGLDVVGANVNVNVTREGRVLTAGGSFIPFLEDARRSASPSLSAAAATEAAALHLGLELSEPLEVRERAGGAAQATLLSEGGIAREPIPAELVFFPVEGGVRLAWALRIDERERPHVWAMHIDAATGEVLEQHDMVIHDHWGSPEPAASPASRGAGQDLAPFAEAPAAWHPPMALAARDDEGPTYNVYPIPYESPSHAGDPMEDLREVVTNPADPLASPLGWHDTGTTAYTVTRGNNVYAYADARDQDQPSGANNLPDGGEDLLFDFPLNFNQGPASYRLAAVTNLFYWNNILHDVLYRYGFDEPSGNFQTNNFGLGGAGNDPVMAEAQDGYEQCSSPWGCSDNANFYTPPDGSSPRMQMYVWTQTNPHRDGDFDTGIIAHEYGHGVSIRLTGGPSNVGCLNNTQQMGEGWSDYFGMILTMREGDTPEQRRGVGTYALGQPVTGTGIRPAPYSTSMAVNNYTYNRIRNLAVPHGVGFLWATMLWEMTWELIGAYGFDPDIHNAEGGAGNQLALQLVIDGLKLQPCSPGFVDGRNAILAADEALTGGANALYIWRAFAKRGLGYSAVQGSSNSTSGVVEAFDMPPGMRRDLTFEAEAEAIPNGELAAFTLTFENGEGLDPLEGVVLSATLPENARYVPGSASDGGALVGDRIEWPAFEAGTGTTTERSFLLRAEAETETVVYFSDDMEEGPDNWEVSHGVGTADWAMTSTGGHEGSAGWYGQNVNTYSDQYLTLAKPIALDGPAELYFHHRYSFEGTSTPYDGGVIEISTNGGTTWSDLGDDITENGYTGTISTSWGNPLAGRPAFTGSSGGWLQTVVDLSPYIGEEVLIRFRLGTDQIVGADGWYVDNVTVSTAPTRIASSACAEGVTGVPCAPAVALVIEAIEEGAPALEIDEKAIEIVRAVNDSTAAVIELAIGNAGDRELDVFLGSEAEWLAGARLAVSPDSAALAELQLDVEELAVGDYEATLHVVSNDPERPEVVLEVLLRITGGVGAEEGALAGAYRLSAAYPNPLRSSARISLEVAEAQEVRVVLYDALGREVARLHEGALAAGAERVLEIDASGLASGVYVVRATGEAFTATQRLTVVR